MSNANPSTMVTISAPEETALSPTRSFNDLSAEEKDIVTSLVAKLDDYSDTSLIAFSSETSANSAREAEDFLKQTKLNDLTEFNECMGSLSKSLRSINTKELSKQDPSPLCKIPIIGEPLAKSRLGKKVESVIDRQENVKKTIDLTIKTIEGIKLTLREDLLKCASTRQKTVEFAKYLEYEYIALYEKRLELERAYNEFISSPSYNPANLDHSEYTDKLQNGMQSIERKMDATLRLRTNAVQDIPSLSFIRNAENAMINTIDDCIKNIVPEWNKAFHKAILAYRVANAAEVIKATKKTTNDILLASSEITANAIVSSAEAIETPHIATATLEKKTEIFLSMCDQLVQIATEASKQRLADSSKLKEIESQSLIHGGKRKTVQLIGGNNGGVS